MAMTERVERAFSAAEKRATALRQRGYAVAAHYDKQTSHVVVQLNTVVQISFPPHLVEGLAEASPDDLVTIEISPSGLGLHWPRLDADLYIPGLMAGQFGSRRWMAAQLGSAGGRVRSPAKAASSLENGRRGSRPRRV